MNSDYITVLKNEEINKVFIFNRDYSTGIKTSKEVYDIIKDFNSIDELVNIANDYQDVNEQRFFKRLIEEFKKCHIFDRRRNNQLQKVTFAITDFCNLKCTHCCFSAGYLKNKTENISNIDVLRKIIEINPMLLAITGGEPLCVSNFDEVLRVIKNEYSGKVILATNATLITEANVISLCDVFDAFDISIDGINEETTSEIRGKGTFSKVIEAIGLIKKNSDKPISLSMAIDNKTQKYIDEFNELCNSLKVEPVIRAMNLIGRAKQNHIDSDEFVQFAKGDASCFVGCYDCDGGVNQVFIKSNGDVYPCAMFTEDKYQICNILNSNLGEKLGWNKENSWFREFSEYIPNFRKECRECEVNTFCWSCPSLMLSFINNNNITKLSDVCGYKKTGILEALWNEPK